MIYLLAKSAHTILANCTTSKRLVISTTILTLWTWVIMTGQFSWWKIWWIIFTKRTRTLHFIENHCIQQVYCGWLRHWSSGLWLSLEQNSIPNWTKNWASFLVSWRPIQIYNLTIFWCVTMSANSNTVKLVFDYQDDLVQKKFPNNRNPNNLSTTSTRIENLISIMITISTYYFNSPIWMTRGVGQ